LSESKVSKNRIKIFNNTTDSPSIYPNGWIPVLESRKLKMNEIKPIITFCYELIVFRGILENSMLWMPFASIWAQILVLA
jgi:hypothetical protein